LIPYTLTTKSLISEFKRIAQKFAMNFFLKKTYKKSKEILGLIIKKKNILYNFSFFEIQLYLKEKNWKLYPSIQEEEDKEDYLLRINDVSIYWPKKLKSDSLPWLYNEVFFPFKNNPSSYDNHLLEIHNCDWVIDGGACEGFFSIFCHVRGIKIIITVEPNKIITNSLTKTIKDIYKIEQAVIVEAGLGEIVGKGFLEYNAQRPSDSFINKSNHDFNISIETIDNIVATNNLNNRGLIKLDIEGFEMDALSGAQKVLRDKKPKLAIAVYHSFENAVLCRDIILRANPSYKIIFRGMYAYYTPPRPYMLFAY